MMAGDEFYDDETTSGPEPVRVLRRDLRVEHPQECPARHPEYSLDECTHEPDCPKYVVVEDQGAYVVVADLV